MRVCPACAAAVEGLSWTCTLCGRQPAVVDGYRSFAPDLASEFDGFESEFFGSLADVEPGSFWFNARNDLILWGLRRYFAGAKTFLEIGCGTGYVLSGVHRAMPEMRLTATEALTAGLKWAAERVPEAELLQMDARRLPFREEFDVIGAFDVVEHIEEDEQVLREMHKAVRPGGGILLTVPQHQSLWSVADDVAHHKRRYSRSELMKKVRAAGFTVVRATSFVSLLLPALLLARLRPRSRAQYDSRAEHQFSPVASRALSAIMSVERAAIRGGVSFPAGGSLFMVARR